MVNDDKLLDLLSNKKVLYAEDEKGIQNNVVKILKLYFDTVITANNGEDALDEYYTTAPDVVILDICMPGLDGLEVVKRIRKENKKIPIMILSAYTDNEYLWRAVEQKICKYLTKPFNKDKFIKALKNVSLELSNYETEVKIKDGYYCACNKIFKKGDKQFQLTRNESKLLEYLLSKANQTVTFEELFDYIWVDEQFPTKEPLKALIKDLRKIVGKETIKNIFAIGYKLEI